MIANRNDNTQRLSKIDKKVPTTRCSSVASPKWSSHWSVCKPYFHIWSKWPVIPNINQSQCGWGWVWSKYQIAVMRLGGADLPHLGQLDLRTIKESTTSINGIDNNNQITSSSSISSISSILFQSPLMYIVLFLILYSSFCLICTINLSTLWQIN